MGQSIKVSTAPVITVTAFHKDAVAICRTGMSAYATQRDKLQALLVTKYGPPAIVKDAKGTEMSRSGGPSFEQYRADQAALREAAQDARPVKGADVGQWVRKQFARAVQTLYGQLPASTDPAAIAKAAQRAAAKAAAPATAAAAPASTGAQDHGQSEAEAIESVVTRLGLFRTLEACIHILQADERTKAQAEHIARMVKKAAALAA
jgi:hypothetical protein